MIRLRKLYFVIIILLLFSGCKSLVNINYDEYIDSFKDGVYSFNPNGLRVIFGTGWGIITRYREFNEFQKRFAEYYKNETGEVIFFGYNQTKGIRVKATANLYALQNKAYFDKILDFNSQEIALYNITYLYPQKYLILDLPKVSALQFVYEYKLNDTNSYIFDSWLVRNGNYNIRIDFWIKKDKYEAEKAYIRSIVDSIDFVNAN